MIALMLKSFKFLKSIARWWTTQYNFKLSSFVGYGETITIAEEMAAKDSLNRIFGLTLDRKPFTYGDVVIDVKSSKPNVSLKELTG